MRRAEWRERTDDPKTPLGWWWRGFVRGGWPFDASLVAATWLLNAFVPLAWALIAGMAVKVVAGGVGALTIRDDLKPLLTDPAIQGQFRALVTYRREEVITGRDEMALTVVDAWLVAEGVRSEFAIRPQDVRSVPGALGEGYALALSDGSKISLRGLPDRGRRVLDAWRQYEVCTGGEPTFPPARVHPQERARWKAWTCYGLTIIVVSVALPQALRVEGLIAIFWPLSHWLGGALIFGANRRLTQLNEVHRCKDDAKPVERSDRMAGLGQAGPHQEVDHPEEANVHVA